MNVLFMWEVCGGKFCKSGTRPLASYSKKDLIDLI